MKRASGTNEQILKIKLPTITARDLRQSATEEDATIVLRARVKGGFTVPPEEVQDRRKEG